MTILREWRGRAAPDKAPAVLEFYRKNVKPVMLQSDGCLNASFCSREVGSLVEFVLLAFWRDEEAMQAYTGPTPDRAAMLDGTQTIFIDSDTFVRMYDIVDQY